MAFACCVRKSATKLASVCGRVRSISAVMNHPSLDFNPSPMSPFVSRGFFNSMAVDDKLSPEQSLHLVIDSELNSALQTDDPNLEQNEEMAPGSFPFKIRDKPGDQSVTLTAYYNDEHIHIDVGMPYLGDDVIDVFGPSNDELSFPLVVTVTKKNAVRIEFTCNAYADYIDLTDLTVHDYPFPMGETDWPRFKNLDDNLKKAFHRYLATRLEASITKLLHKYMVGKTKREYLLWLKNVKKFVDG